MFSINNLRHSWHERKGFRLLRANGTRDFVFIHFISPVQIVLDKKVQHAPAHSCIIYPPDSYHEFFTVEEPLNHDWIHFLPIDNDFADKLGLPVNTLFFPRDARFIASLVTTMEHEFINRPPLWDRHIDGLMICLCSLLGRETTPISKSGNGVMENTTEFDRLRLDIYHNPAFPWSINHMASRLRLSRSRFSVLYRQLYGISPIEDLISTRIDRAKYLLSTTSLPLQSVSAEVGYCTLEHFVRQFKNRMGYSPSSYRSRGG